MTDTKTKPATKQPQSITVDDPDGKRFYQYDNHDALLLSEGDRVYHNDRLCVVKTTSKIHRTKTREGEIVSRMVQLDDGHKFDAGHDDSRLMSLTFWRPRQGL